MTQKAKVIWGYTQRKHLIVDLDHASIDKARVIAKMIMKNWPFVGDCLIIFSSEYRTWIRKLHLWKKAENYHLVFNNKISYTRIKKILRTLYDLRLVESKFWKVRDQMDDLTLRVNEKHEPLRVKKSPYPVKYIVNPYNKKEGGMIKEYWEYVKMVHDVLKDYEGGDNA